MEFPFPRNIPFTPTKPTAPHPGIESSATTRFSHTHTHRRDGGLPPPPLNPRFVPSCQSTSLSLSFSLFPLKHNQNVRRGTGSRLRLRRHHHHHHHHPPPPQRHQHQHHHHSPRLCDRPRRPHGRGCRREVRRASLLLGQRRCVVHHAAQRAQRVDVGQACEAGFVRRQLHHLRRCARRGGRAVRGRGGRVADDGVRAERVQAEAASEAVGGRRRGDRRQHAARQVRDEDDLQGSVRRRVRHRAGREEARGVRGLLRDALGRRGLGGAPVVPGRVLFAAGLHGM